MIKTNELTKFTPKIKGYLFTNLVLLILVLTIVFSMAGNSSFFGVLIFLLIVLGLPAYIYIIVMYNYSSFVISENNITINSGVMVKRSKSIPFNNIQSINCKQGLMMGFFGITNFDIWTSSQSQLNINNGNTVNKPDGNLVLTSEDAEWLRGFITYKPEDK